MDKPIIIQIEPTPEIVSLLETLIKSSAVKVSNKANPLDEYLTHGRGGAGVESKFHTLREWVAIKKMIPFSRLGNNPKGDVRILRRHQRKPAEAERSL